MMFVKMSSILFGSWCVDSLLLSNMNLLANLPQKFNDAVDKPQLSFLAAEPRCEFY